MTKNNKILHDLSKVASSTVATMVNIKNDLATYIKHQVKVALKNMDFVSKNDFQALKKSVEAINNELHPNKTHHAAPANKSAAPAKPKVAKKKAVKSAAKPKKRAVKK